MGLFGGLTGALGAIGGVANALSGTLGSVRGVGSALGVNLLPAVGPTVPTFISSPQPVAMSAAGPAIRSATKSMPLLSGGMRALSKGVTATAATAMIKMAETLGRRSMTLREAVRIIKRTGRLMGPAATAVAIGITIDEMAELIMLDSARKRRRMNPANISALRRSMRRISSFHRLAQKADALRGSSRRRRTSSCKPGGSGSIVQVK